MLNAYLFFYFNYRFNLYIFSVGQSTALIIESGASGTSCVPVLDGYPLLKCIIIIFSES